MPDYLGWSVQRGSALSIPQDRRIDWPSEITKFDGVLVQEDIFSLDITVNHIIFMQVLQRWANFFDVFSDISLTYGVFAHFFVDILT